jgi:hypothetical protein
MRGPAVRTAYPSRRLQAAVALQAITEEVDAVDIEEITPPESGFRASAPAQQVMQAAAPSSRESLIDEEEEDEEEERPHPPRRPMPSEPPISVHERATVRPPPMLAPPQFGANDVDPPTLLTRVPADAHFDADEVIEEQATRVKRDSASFEDEVVEDQLTRVRKPVSLSLPPPPPPASKPSMRVRTPSGHSPGWNLRFQTSSSSNQRVAFPAPQFSAPLQPKPFVPVAPVTQPTLVDEAPKHRLLSRPKLPTPATLTESPSESLVSVPAQALPPTVRRAPTPSAWKIDMSSIAPVAMPIRGGGGHSRMADRTVQLRAKKRSAGVTFFLIVIGLLLGGVVGVLVIVPGAYSRARNVASAYVDQIVGVRPKAEPTVSMPPPPPPAAATPVPPAMLDTRPVIESDMTQITFPSSAKGHRIYVDGKLTTLTAEQPTKMKCGMHTIRISGSKTKTVDLPCGRDVILTD